MREIKFRAWNKKQKFMDTVWLIDWEHGKVCHRSHNQSELDDCVLMQYTGLVDKNGTEIYEGDIVDIGIPLDRTRKNFIGEISYCTEFACFRVDHPNIILISEYDGIEIIGNIYEHPHLLGD